MNFQIATNLTEEETQRVDASTDVDGKATFYAKRKEKQKCSKKVRLQPENKMGEETK
jgi:hypothetical protein